MSDQAKSTSFGQAASAYESGRPGYPAEAVAWLLERVREPGRGLRVADVGAGTGKLTRSVVELGADVVAVDPDADMLAIPAGERARRAHVRRNGRESAAARFRPRRRRHGAGVALGRRRAGLPRGRACAAQRGRAGAHLEHPRRQRRLGETADGGDGRFERRGAPGDDRTAGGGALRGAGAPRVAWDRQITLPQLRDLVGSRSDVITASPRSGRASTPRSTGSWHPCRDSPTAGRSRCRTSPTRSARGDPDAVRSLSAG